jgi:hypothetical protein
LTDRRALIAFLSSLLTVAALLGPVAAEPALAGVFAGTVIDGPSPDITGAPTVSTGRDGTGGVAYLKQVGGVVHAFASTLTPGGTWGAPQQLDAGLAGSASQVEIAAASNGRVAAAFVNGGVLYTTVQDSDQSSFAAPQSLAGGAVNPWLSISTNGTAYVSYTAAGPAGATDDVYAARLDRSSTSFQQVGGPANLDPTRRAGYDAATRSQVATATDGAGLITWGEQGADGRTHVIARRVAVQGLSPAVQDLTLPSLQGQPGGSADTPFADLRDAADFGWVVFRQTFMVGGVPEPRAIARFERGSGFDAPAVVDPLSFPSADGAAAPQVGLDGTGDGLIAVGLAASHQVYADPILDPVSVMDPELGTPERLDSASANSVAPQPVAAIGGIDDVGAVGWEQSTGAADPPSVHIRPFNNSGFAAEATISTPLLGPVDTSPGGLTGGSDRYGDVFFAFVQGDPGSRRVVLGGLANPPGDFDLVHAGTTNLSRPVFTWTAAKDILGLAGYEVRIDGKVVATVHARRFQVSTPLSNGRHRLSVVAIDRYGQRTSSPVHVVRVNTRKRRPRRSAARHG